MTEQFHEGQEVAVYDASLPRCMARGLRRKAKIIRGMEYPEWHGKSRVYEVQFPDGTRAVFDAEHIRVISGPTEHPYEESHAAFEASRVRK